MYSSSVREKAIGSVMQKFVLKQATAHLRKTFLQSTNFSFPHMRMSKPSCLATQARGHHKFFHLLFNEENGTALS
jgi:hypothetical protein